MHSTAEDLKVGLSGILAESRTTMDKILEPENMAKASERQRDFDFSQIKVDTSLLSGLEQVHTVLDMVTKTTK